MAQILGIFAPEFEDLSVILNGLQGLLGSGPQLLLQITLYLYGIIDLNPHTSPLQAVNFLLGVVIVGRSVVMYDILYKEGTTSNRELTISLSKKFRYCIQVKERYRPNTNVNLRNIIKHCQRNNGPSWSNN